MLIITLKKLLPLRVSTPTGALAGSRPAAPAPAPPSLQHQLCRVGAKLFVIRYQELN